MKLIGVGPNPARLMFLEDCHTEKTMWRQKEYQAIYEPKKEERGLKSNQPIDT